MLSNFAIMVIVIVACLGVTALAAGISSHFSGPDDVRPVYDFPHEQRLYMQSVRRSYFADLLSGMGQFKPHRMRAGESRREERV
ncbi:hypothetical protein ABOM_003981 [Aspergillus bombycis]|uniref:Uncharacterized protein n=1 Tax=Aspergillus bombycis TaxID=109264 RepID=A0A1F8A635_9EURO|nr:hypothetical protein ABOM_003981 [Aspergillus bombycis]OGM47230.1 hypothetical protein ABOM_003981 [Aspergillus bombycis]